MPHFSKRTVDKPLQPIKSYTLWLLSHREYSEKELKTKLLQKGYESDEVATVITLCQEYKFQDDGRYAEMKSRQDARRMGNRNVSARLAQKGIEGDIATEAIQELEPELTRALRLVSKFENKQITPEVAAKIWQYFSYRGFSSGTIRAVTTHLKNQYHDNTNIDAET